MTITSAKNAIGDMDDAIRELERTTAWYAASAASVRADDGWSAAARDRRLAELRAEAMSRIDKAQRTADFGAERAKDKGATVDQVARHAAERGDLMALRAVVRTICTWSGRSWTKFSGPITSSPKSSS